MSLNLMMFIHKIIYPKNDGTYSLNLDEYKLIKTQWIALDVNGDNMSASYDLAYFDSFRAELIPKEF